jgi:hypothetical protein
MAATGKELRTGASLDADVHPRYDQHMVGSGALEVDSGVAVDEGVFANDHRINQGGLGRRPEFMHLVDDSAVQPAAPKCDAAARKAREPIDVFCFRGAQGGDVSIGEVGSIVESAGITKILR